MDTGDTVSPITRFVAILVIPFLWLAFIILCFFPDQTGERFAWAIKPHMTAFYMGAGYLGGSWLFLNAVIKRRWHQIAGGFLPVTTFTWAMLFATILHWDRFSHGKLGFFAWLVLYIVTPFLIPTLWFFNQRNNTKQPEPHDLLNPIWVRWLIAIFGVAGFGFTLASFISPDLIITTWAWTLTPLTGRILAGWGMLLSVGGIVMAFESRWSAWRVPLQCIIIWHVLTLIGTGFNAGDFTNGIFNWFTVATTVVVGSLIAFSLVMESNRKFKSSEI